MSASPPRSGNAHSRNASLSGSLREVRPPVVAHRRTPSQGRRPPLAAGPPATAATRSASAANPKRCDAKTRTAPVSGAAKRQAAKGASLRTRMPYLRPSTSPTPTPSTDAQAHLPPRLPQRSFSSGAGAQGAAAASSSLKSSPDAIAEALQRVKKVCGASKDAAEKDASVVLGSSGGSGGGRERRQSRPSSMSGGRGDDVGDDAASVIHTLEMMQGVLFSSLQVTTAVEALSPLSPQRDAAGSHFQRSKSCSSPLESPLISAGPRLFLSRKERRRAWTQLLHKNSHVFPILIGAARSPLAMREAKVAATILTFLYNVLRHLVGERQRRSVLLCEKLGVIPVCTAVLEENRRRLRFEAASSSAWAACLRACEAAGLLFTLGHTFNAKLSAAFRISQSLHSTFACASAVFAVVESEFAAFQLTLQLGDASDCVSEKIKRHGTSHARKDTLKALRTFQAHTQWSVTTFSHYCFTLFVFTANAASAKELSSRGAELCATAIAMSTYFLSQVAPVLLSNVVYERPEDTLHPAVGPLIAIDHAHWAPAWVVRLLRHVELMLLWCVALLNRLGSCDKVQGEVAAVALRSHVPRACSIFLLPAAAEAVQLAPRRECVHVALLLLATLLSADRTGALADLNELGGLKALTTSVLALHETGAQQWHHYYEQLAAMYGCLHLPAMAGHKACYVDQRIPPPLRRLTPWDTSTVTGLNAAAEASLSTTPHAFSGPAAVLQDEASVQHVGGSAVTSHASTAATDSLRDAEALVGLPAAVQNSALPCLDNEQGDIGAGLLLVDTQPSLFSPELHSGMVDAASALVGCADGHLPWPFSDAAPPTTAERWQGTPSHIASIHEDEHLQVPLKDVREEDRVHVLRHHIARLAGLDETACDATAHPHVYKVVFERKSSAAPDVAPVVDTAVQPSTDGISFFSDFEGGNLQRAVEVADNEFDLVLSWDTATNSYTQWFNFGLRSFTPGKTYHFNILNMEKLGSTFNEGQKPLMLHVADSTADTDKKEPPAPPPHWQRVGHNIFYFRNTYERPARAHFFPKDMEIGGPTTVSAGSAQASSTSHAAPRCPPQRSFTCTAAPRLSPSRTPPTPPPVVAVKKRTPPPSRPAGGDDSEEGGKKQKNFFTVSFSVAMPMEGSGRVYLANCFPFTYTEMRQHLSWLAAHTAGNVTHAMRAQTLCVTPGGLPVPLLTVTALRPRNSTEPYTAEEIRHRPIALLVARVHPGETNASWVMQGLLDALLCPTAATAASAAALCETFVFKIVPMLNVDGVMMGNHRCSFAGMDMNRDYLEPKAELNPTLFALKQLLRYWRQEEGRQTVVFADFHGHSRAKNFLVYGCTSETMRGIARHLGGKDKKTKAGGRRRAKVRQTSVDAPLGPEKFLAALLNHIFPSFSLSQSSFAVTKDKISSARVVLYDEFGVRMSYGFEATMVGGRISTPSVLQPASEAPSTACAVWGEEVHYGPTVFRAMGDAFVRAFAALSAQWLAATATTAATTALGDSGDSEHLRKSGTADTTGGAEVLQALWCATAAAGAGRDAPKGRPEEPMTDAVLPEPRAGPYALATRGDRRQGNGSPLSAAAAKAAVPSRLPAVSAAGQLDALNYLFLSDLREAPAQEGEDEDDDVDNRSVDGSEVSSVAEVSDADLDRRRGKAAGRGQANTTQRCGQVDGSDAGNRSASSVPSDSGSDDHDWSGYNSSASSGGEDIDVERSSVSSVNDDIPTNLFT